MKKFLKIFALLALLILAALIILPQAFKGKIMKMVKQEINKSVNARVDFSGASLSLIRSFPDFQLRLKQLSVVGNFPFEADTLAFIPLLDLTFDFRSVFKGSPYEIRKIVLNKPAIKLLVLKDGAYNWDILLPEEELTEAEVAAQVETPVIVMNMKELQLKDGYFIYDDRELDMVLRLFNVAGEADGELSETISVFNTQATASNIEIVYEGVTYLGGIKPTYSGQFEVDLDRDYYTMRHNRVFLNDLAIDVEGGFGFVGDDMVFDMSFESKDKDFKKLLSLVPAIYARDFKKVRAEGGFELSGFIKGLYGDVAFPGFGLNMSAHRASFKYPDLPAGMDNIWLDLKVVNKTGQMDATTVDVSRLDFTMAGNPFTSKFFLKTPVSNPDIVASFKGIIDLTTLSKVLPLKPEEVIDGLIDFDTRFSGNQRNIENKKYKDVAADGWLIITGLNYQPGNVPFAVKLHETKFNFTPSLLYLEKLNTTIGQSQIEATGRVENYLGYLFDDEYLSAKLSVKSGLLDINELLAGISSEKAPAGSSSETKTTIPELPERMDLTFDMQADRLLYQKYDLTNVKAILTYKDQVLAFNPLSADLLSGQVVVAGSFDARDTNLGLFDLNLNITDFDIPQAYQAIGLLQQAAPIAEKTKGKFITGFKLKGKLDGEFNLIYESLLGGGLLKTSQIRIESVEVMNQLAAMLGNDDYKRLVTDGIDFAFQFVNGKVFQQPFTINWGGAKTIISGYVGFDKQIDLALNFHIPYEKFGPGANKAVKKLADEAARFGVALSPENGLLVNAKLTGSVLSPKISLEYKSAVANLKTEIQDYAQQEIDKQKEEALRKVSAEAQKILDDARLRSEELISKATQLAEKLRSEAITASQKVISEAEIRATRLEEEGKKKGPVAEAAAREASRRIRVESQNTAKKIVSEADIKANAIVAEAHKQSDELMQKAQEQVDKLQ